MTPRTPRHSRAPRTKRLGLRGWLELLRLPNLFTVPGDVLVGWCLSGMRGWVPLCGIGASLLLYSAGLLWNDAFDARTDAAERPTRPIPSGRISRSAVFRIACILAVMGVLLAGRGWQLALLLAGLILLYDAIAKHIPGVGILCMGCCRGANVLLGAAVSWSSTTIPLSPALLLATLFFTAYIILVSAVALNEASPRARLRKGTRWLPFWMTLALIPLFWALGLGFHFSPLLASVALIPLLLTEQRLPAFVAGLIRHTILLQLLWCLLAYPSPASLGVTGALLTCWLLANLSGRFFAGS